MSDITVLAFPVIAYPIQETDVLYVIRGTGADRDTKAEASSFLRQTINVDALPVTVDLSTATGDATIFVDVTGVGVLTLSNELVKNKQLKIVNVGTSSFSVAGSWVEPSVVVGDVLTLFSNGTTLYKDFSIVTDGTRLRKRVILIGDWDMNATSFLNVPIGITGSDIFKIREISVLIIDDLESKLYFIDADPNNADVRQGKVDSVDQSFGVALSRKTGGFFDSTLYDATSFNRGHITITYEV
jgi:hypothetical protein